MRLATSTLRTIAKNGLHKTAQKYGVNLNKYSISFGTSTVKLERLKREAEAKARGEDLTAPRQHEVMMERDVGKLAKMMEERLKNEEKIGILPWQVKPEGKDDLSTVRKRRKMRKIPGVVTTTVGNLNYL
jgi:hypothetical protein